MFKCPDCNESLKLISKLKIHPKIPIYCDNCKAQIVAYRRFYYLTYFAILYLLSMSIRVGYFMWWEVAGVTMFLFFITQLLQPIRKLSL